MNYDGSHLPEQVIHLIQSFLTGKEAASTAILSKSWYKCWVTRPEIEFDERDFENYNASSPYRINFVNYVERYIQRYRGLELTPKSLKLCMIEGNAAANSVAQYLIEKAPTLGAPDLEFEIQPPFSRYILPVAFFESKHLVNLSAVGCKIHESCFGNKDMFSGIESIKFRRVYVEEAELDLLVKKCPSLVSLVLCDCEGLRKIEVSKIERIKNLTIIYHHSPLYSDEPFVEFIEGERDLTRSDTALFTSKFHHLTRLFLERVEIGERLFRDFSSIFPCLEDLTVRNCTGSHIFDISSNSLKHINLAYAKHLILRLNIPNIRQFKFSGSSIPHMSLMGPSREWASDVELACWVSIDGPWFLRLRSFLTELKSSKICLGINLFRGEILGNDVSGENLWESPGFLSIPYVHNLSINARTSNLVCPNLLSHLSCSMRPETITACLYPTLYENLEGTSDDMTLELAQCKANNALLRLLCEEFKSLERANYLNARARMWPGQLVKSVKAEIYEDSLRKWCHLPWLTLMGFLRMSEKKNRVRLKITWGPAEVGSLPMGYLTRS